MKKRRPLVWAASGILIVLAALVLVPRAIQEEETPMENTLTVESPAFQNGGAIPARYAGTGEDISPPLTVTGLPGDTRSVAIVMDDIDAPVFGTITHWLIWNIPPASEIPENIPKEKKVSSPDGACQGRNVMFRIGYMGPNPPSGTHRYRFHVYALDTMLDLAPGANHRKLQKAMEGHIIGYGLLTGIFSK